MTADVTMTLLAGALTFGAFTGYTVNVFRKIK